MALLPDKSLPFDSSAQQQQAQKERAAAHDAAEPFGEMHITDAGKILIGAVAGALLWFGVKAYGWAQPKPVTKGKRR